MSRKTQICYLVLISLLLHLSNNWCMVTTYMSPGTNVSSIDYSPDGSMIAVGGMSDNSVVVYDAKTFNIILNITTTGSTFATAVRFSIDSNMVAIGYKNGSALVYFINNKTTVTFSTTQTGQNQINDLAWTSSSLAFCGNTSSNVININNNFSNSGSGSKLAGSCSSIAFTTDNSLLVQSTTATVTVAKSSNYATSSSVPFNMATKTLTCLAYRPDKTVPSPYNFIVGIDSSTSIYYTNGTVINSSVGALACAYSQTLDFFATGGTNKNLTIFNATSNTSDSVYTLSNKIQSMDFSNDGVFLAVGVSDGSINILTQNCNSKCDVSLYFDLTNNACTPCGIPLLGCVTCYNSGTCKYCSQSYYLAQNKTCLPCYSTMPGCSTCSSNVSCTSPLPGYYIIANGNTSLCQTAITGCQICNNTIPPAAQPYCSQCFNQYYPSSGKCSPCSSIAQCLKCTSSSTCVQCAIGYFLNSSKCSPCSSNCLDCLDNISCSICIPGYYSTGALCLTCSSGCLACNNTGYCLDCISQMFIDSNGNCSLCTAPCITCQNTSISCLSCILGYFLSSSTCQLCNSTCQSCNDSNGVCLTCLQGYYLSGSTCNKCPVNCLSCATSSCILCETGYYVNSGNCTLCSTGIHGCVVCNSTTNCFYCAVGHYLNSTSSGNNSCLPCAVGCSTCESNTNCSTCTPGYIYSSFSCNKCSALCTTCIGSSTNCSSCIVGYYLQITTNGICKPCDTLYSGCVACINDTLGNTICTQCVIGQYLNGNSCSLCNVNCVTCSGNSTSCLSCPISYYLNATTCLTCNPACESCISNITCLSCNTGYYLSSTSCVHCPIPCITCNSSTQCLSCDVGYFYSSSQNKCQICTTQILNCLFCNEGTCFQCAYGYVISSPNSCVSCSNISGCYQCSSLTSCLACQSGYYLDGQACSPCPDGCIVCSNSTFCLSCATSFFYGSVVGSDGQCLRCINYLAGCEICSNNTDCGGCLSGYYMQNGSHSVCKLCQTSIAYCQICNSSTVCTSCKGGYFLSNKICLQCSLTACQLCDSSGSSCLSCQSGYYLQNGSCILCGGTAGMDGCQICTNSSNCLECQSGYYLSTNKCILCQSQIPGCIYCNDSSKCLTCDSGYYQNSLNYSCQPCSATGCEICEQKNSTICVTCTALYYKNSSSPTTCSLCISTITGCLTCTNNTQCTKCDVGYYLDNNFQCSMCSAKIQGCSICNSNTSCLQCKSMYFLNSTKKCQICSQPLQGCVFCTNGSQCLSCGSNFYMNQTTHLCEPCTDLLGCLVCQNSTVCIFCDNGYFIDNISYNCSQCSNTIEGCYSCISSKICTSCIGGYILNSNSSCDPAQLSANGNVATASIILKTFYQDSQTLKHELYAKDMTFTKTNLDWASNFKLSIVANNGTEVTLTIKYVQWSNDNDYTLIIYTNNPIDYSIKNAMPFARRLLGASIDLSLYKTSISISEPASQLILPNYQHSGPLIANYPLSSPEFYQSYIITRSVNFPFYIFGAIIVLILLIIYLIKALITVPQSPNIGNIIPHIMAFKVGAMLLFPTYLQYVNYCTGFMWADLFWVNKTFASHLSDRRDYSPPSFSIFFTNMNIASMYMLNLCILLFVCIVAFIISKKCQQKNSVKMNAFFTFLYNYFVFGVTFAGCASLQGAIMNPISSLNINALFYIIGILLYFFVICQCIYKMSQNKIWNFWKIRVLLKATLLSLSHFNPIYLLSSAVIVDLILIWVQYKITQYPKIYSKCWIYANVMSNLALILLVFVPIIILSLILVSLSIISIIIAQTITHYSQVNAPPGATSVDLPQNVKDFIHIWQFEANKTKAHNTQKQANAFDGQNILDDKLFTQQTPQKDQDEPLQTKYHNNHHQITNTNQDLQYQNQTKYVKRQRNFKKSKDDNKNQISLIGESNHSSHNYHNVWNSGENISKKLKGNTTNQDIVFDFQDDSNEL